MLEERDRVGGQLLTVKQDGFLMEAGTTILPEAYGSVMQLLRDCGLEDQLLPASYLMGFMRGDDMHLLRANRLALDAARTSLLSMRAKLKAGRLALDAFKLRKVLSYEDLSIEASTTSKPPRSTRSGAASTASSTTTSSIPSSAAAPASPAA